MATYHVFAGYNYYPEGGLADYVGGYTGTLEEAIAAAEKQAIDASCDWFEIVAEDTDTNQLVVVYNGKQGRVNEGANLE